MNEKDSARLVFEGKEGDAVVVSLIDMGGRLRLICQAASSLTTGVERWITAESSCGPEGERVPYGAP